MLGEMMPHMTDTTRTPTAVEDRKAIEAHYRAEARRQETEDARARWLGYRSETDFTERASSYLDRHPALSRAMLRHARFIYFGKDRD